MNPSFPPTVRRLLHGTLALALGFAMLATSRGLGDDPPRTPKDKEGHPHARQIADLERQIADLQAKLKALRDGKELLPMPGAAPTESALPEEWVKAMKWRCIGPATMGGRITSVAVYEADPTTYWVATASGGLLRTTNNGVTFEHQFDKQGVVSIGAVAVAPSDRNVVWVGTGEANPRNSVSYGDGVYRSTDGGKSWQHMGLKDAFQIGKILVHPKDPSTVYVGALGRLYGPNPERGLYKTTDGGKSWRQVLKVDDKTGVIDVAMSPADPETLIVAMWERQRDEFDSFLGDAKTPEASDPYAPAKVHGPGGGLFRTTNGGKSWDKLSSGLPTVPTGRIGLDWSRKSPNTVFAIIDTVKAGEGSVIAYLGVTGEDTPEGGKITNVSEKGPAEAAGLKPGDVVVAFDGKPVKSYRDLQKLIRGHKPGDKVKVAALRGKEKKEFTVALGERPDTQRRAFIGLRPVEAKDGVRVVEVVEKGPAAKAGLKPEDLITAFEGKPIRNPQAFAKDVAGRKPGDKVKLKVRRGKEDKEFVVTLEPAPGRPYSTGRLGGQRENVQDDQGPEGVQTGGVYKSVDGGKTWARVNSINHRPMYFSVVRVDPTDDNTLYALGISMYVSTDGGKTFNTAATRPGPDGKPQKVEINKGVHPDQHAMWIDPKDGRHMLVGTDGGFYVTYDRAATWDHLNTTALGQVYHVAVDTRRPYRVYGGLQDNGSWGGPSHVMSGPGPVNDDWIFVSGGDGFVCQVDPTDPDLVYFESQDGFMGRRNLRTGERSQIRPRPQAGTGGYRFNWNTPFILSHHNPRIYYCGGNYVFRSINRGDDLRIISPEITRTKRGSATALAESPKNPDVLWAGTDDGAVWVTRDGGRNWTNLGDRFKSAGLPGPRWVASIEPSRKEEGRCYVVFDAHRSNDDQPYVFVTEDYGQSWKSLRGNLPWGSTRVLREDRVNPNVLYLGTEFAAWASADRGASWTKLNGTSLPTVAVHEFAQPETANELVAGTHGRSVWVLDVTALRQVTPAVVKEPAHLFTPSPAVRWQPAPMRGSPYSASARQFVGQNPPAGATVEYSLAKKAEKVTLKVVDFAGKTVREFKGEREPGLHRVNWDLRKAQLRKGKPDPAEAEMEAMVPVLRALRGQFAAPGVYRVVLTVDGKEFTQTLLVERDPNVPRDAIAADELEEAGEREEADEMEEEHELEKADRREEAPKKKRGIDD